MPPSAPIVRFARGLIALGFWFCGAWLLHSALAVALLGGMVLFVGALGSRLSLLALPAALAFAIYGMAAQWLPLAPWLAPQPPASRLHPAHAAAPPHPEPACIDLADALEAELRSIRHLGDSRQVSPAEQAALRAAALSHYQAARLCGAPAAESPQP